MGFSIHHAVALLNGGLPNGLSQMTLAGAARAEKQSVFPLADESAGSQIEDQTAIHFRVEIEVELVESLLRVPELGQFAPPLEQSLAASAQLVADQTRDQIDRRHVRALGLVQSGFQHGGHTTEPELS